MSIILHISLMHHQWLTIRPNNFVPWRVGVGIFYTIERSFFSQISRNWYIDIALERNNMDKS